MKLAKRLLVVLLVVCMMTGVLTIVTACKKDCGIGNHTDEGHDGVCDVCGKPTVFKHVDANGDKKCDTCGKDIVYTYNDYLTVTPSNWNELDYSDNNDTAIMGYIGSPFFEYDYQFEGGKFKSDGSINFEGIKEGGFQVKYSAATALEDVTENYADTWNLKDENGNVVSGSAWKITLRNDLKWDDGTPIKAEDFVYTMEQQLNPDFQLTRADTWYNNAVKIHNAKEYFYQGRSILSTFQASGHRSTEIVDGKIGDQLVYIDLGEFWGLNVAKNAQSPINEAVGNMVPITNEVLIRDPAVEEGEDEAYVSAKYIYETYLAPGAPYAEMGYDMQFLSVAVGVYPKLDFDQVGIFADGDYGIVLILDQPQEYIKEDGSLSYLAAYNFGSLPLVKRDLYESCKKSPQSGSTLWTTTYNTSLETTASWGPYSLTEFQTGRQFTLSRNKYWYGYSLAENAHQYQADRIVTQVIAQTEASQLAFWAGQVDGLGIDITLADDYRNSDYAVYTPGSGTFGIQLYGNLEVLKKSGRNNGILAIKEFRGALSLALDRADYNATCYTAHQPCLGVMGPSYYYDVENALTYRGSDAGKQALLRTYGFSLNSDNKWTDGTTVYNSMDDAYDAMTGYNLTKAKQWLETAYQELTENAETYGYDPSKNIVLKFGTSVDNANTRRQFDYFTKWLKNLTDGTSLANKVELVFDASFGTSWSDAFKDGEYEFAAGTGFSGAPFDPFYMIGSNLNIGSLTYHTYWATNKENLTIKLPEGDYEQAGQELTLTVTQWYHSLNGNTSEEDFKYNWGPSSGTPAEVRLQILATLEEYALSNYYFVATTSEYGASLHSAKWSYANDTYNIMMGFGGSQYMHFNYADDEWAAFVQMYGGDLRDFYKGTN